MAMTMLDPENNHPSPCQFMSKTRNDSQVVLVGCGVEPWFMGMGTCHLYLSIIWYFAVPLPLPSKEHCILESIRRQACDLETWNLTWLHFLFWLDNH